MSITPIAEDAPKSEIKLKINEIVEYLNSLDIKPKTPPPSPAPWSNSDIPVNHDYRPKNPEEPLGFWLDPINMLIKREAVPQADVEKWELKHSGQS